MRVLIVGAGASAGAAGLPVTRDFGARLGRVRPAWRRAYPALAAVVAGLEPSRDGWDLGAAWTRLDQLEKFGWALELHSEGQLARAGVELRRALADVYGRPRRRSARSTSARLLDGLLGELRHGDAVISFNYDTFLEHMARRRVELHQGPCDRGHRCVQLLKTHGSLSWVAHRGPEGVDVSWRGPDGRPLLRTLSPRAITEDRLPLVLGVVPIKSELLAEVQQARGAAAVHRTIADQWRAAVALMRRADAVDVLGYSFPADDQYGAFLFAEAVRGRQEPPEVSFYELEENAFEVGRRIYEVFGTWPRWRRAI